MTDNVIQFVPGLKRKPIRERGFDANKPYSARDLMTSFGDLEDTAPSEYCAPDGDCA